MWNLQTKVSFRFATPLTSVPLALWSMGTLKTLFTPKASEIDVIVSEFERLLLIVVLDLRKVYGLINDCRCFYHAIGDCASILILYLKLIFCLK